MRLTDLVHDPFEEFGDDDDPNEAEVEGRAAVREAVKETEQDAAEQGGAQRKS